MAWRPILLLDFDGVLHSYTSGYTSDEDIPDSPNPGAQEFVLKAMEQFEVCVHSGRCSGPAGIKAIEEWLHTWGFPPIRVLDHKPPAFVILDDRALTFNGTWPDVQALRDFRPWWDKSKDGQI